jgi:multicomponent Na+:H+ antiporter subunit F
MWLIAASVLLLGIFPCGVVCAREEPAEAITAMLTISVIVVLDLLLMAVGYSRVIFMDVALVIAVLSLAGGLVFVRFLERWR